MSSRRFIAVFLLALCLQATPVLAGSYESGLKLYHDGDYTTAITFFRDALSVDTQNPNLRYYLADALMRANRLAEAQAEYQKILAIAPYSQAARLSKTALGNIKSSINMTGSRWHLSTNSGTNGGDPAMSGGDDKLAGLSIAGGDYLSEVNNVGNYIRWSLKKMPVRVYVEKAPIGLTSFEPGYVSTVPRAMDLWSKALGGQLSYRMVNQPDQADILVLWADSIDKHGFVKNDVISFVAGLTSPKIIDGQLRTMKVQASTLDIQGVPQTQERMFMTILHELGHALGLQGHSLNPADVMFAHSSNDHLSQRDINTIRHLYMMQADVTNLPAGSQPGSPKHDLENAVALDKSIAMQEALVKAYGNSLNWLNLGTNYTRKAEILNKRGIATPAPETPDDPHYWLNKAIGAYSESIKLAPDDAKALSYRADAFSKMGKYDNALQDINASIKLDDKNADYYLTQAALLINLNRKAEARNAINTYKTLSARGYTNVDLLRNLESRL